jgi:RNase P/RNase MRP subunit p30
MNKNSILLTETNFSRLKEIIKKNKDKIIIYSSDDDELNRKVLEKLEINILLINLENRKDFQKQRSSGFNHVMAKLAKKTNIDIGINLDELIESKNKEKILARLNQNIELCKKNKLKMVFISEKYKRDFHDLNSLGLSLGMPTWMLKTN